MNLNKITDIDWTTWRAVDPATLVFVIRSGQILLIRKKRGLGAGKINGPGGRLEPGETPQACAARELREELGVDAGELVLMGDHRFQFVDGYSTYVHVYRTHEIEGTPIETDEASPRWCDLAEIPFDEMWEDDRYWLPLVIQGRRFSGYWIFDGDHMVDYRLDIQD
jgi:8-oxo-dGTP diphosphatase